MNEYQDLIDVPSPAGFPGRSKYLIQLWYIVNSTLFRLSPHFMYGWRSWLVSLFGAELGEGVKLRPSCKIWYPWKLKIGDHSYVGDDTILYNLDRIEIGSHVSVSYRTFLCTGSHDFRKPTFDLRIAPIVIEDQAWLAADVFVHPGVRIGRGAVVAARSTIRKDVASNTVTDGAADSPVKLRRPA